MKECSVCKKKLSEDNFRADKKGKDKLRSNCKNCEKDSRKNRMLGNKRERDSNINLKCSICNLTKESKDFRKNNKIKCKLCLNKIEKDKRTIKKNERIKNSGLEIKVEDSNFNK